MNDEVPVGVPLVSAPLPLEALHDVELKVEVVLGRARLPLRDLLAPTRGRRSSSTGPSTVRST